MLDTDLDNENPEQTESEAAEGHFDWQYFSVTKYTYPKRGGAKNALCKFCDRIFSGCSTSTAAAQHLAQPVMGQDKSHGPR